MLEKLQNVNKNKEQGNEDEDQVKVKTNELTDIFNHDVIPKSPLPEIQDVRPKDPTSEIMKEIEGIKNKSMMP